MGRTMPDLETERLLIRPFTMDDLDAAHRLFDLEGSFSSDLDERRGWMQWAVLNYRILAWLGMPPYGDRACILKATGELIGSVGIVPYLDSFAQFAAFRSPPDAPATAEVGLFWATSAAHRGKGYATEAARAVADYLFTHEKLGRVIATTGYDNLASQAVMRKLGMTVERNPHPEPTRLQIVGLLENR